MPSFMLFMPIVNVLSNSGTTQNADISTFITWAQTVITFIVSTMDSFLQWMLANPITLIALVLALVVSAVGFLRHLLGA